MHVLKNYQPPPEQETSRPVPSGSVQTQQAHIVNQSNTRPTGPLPTFGETFNQGVEKVPQQPQGPARTWATMADNLQVSNPPQKTPQETVSAEQAAQESNSGKSRKQGKPVQVDPRRTSGRQTKQPVRLQVSLIESRALLIRPRRIHRGNNSVEQ